MSGLRSLLDRVNEINCNRTKPETPFSRVRKNFLVFDKTHLREVLLSTVTTGSFDEPVLEGKSTGRVDLVAKFLQDQNFHLEQLKIIAR